jgi:hypothetical protein
MRATATPTTAAIAGAYCSIVELLLGPLIDKQTPSSSVWLIVGALAVAIPAYFFVFGVAREEMVGLWVLRPALLHGFWVPSPLLRSRKSSLPRPAGSWHKAQPQVLVSHIETEA